MRKKIYSMLVLGSLLLTTSCSLHDDNEIFDTPAAQRIEENIAANKALLESADNGWELHLWMGTEYSAGGYTYLMKFNNDKVTVASDIAEPGYTTSSSYGIIADAGPVLTINTYNTIFHYLANPEADGSQLQQDYEFIITRTTNDSIYLRGKKYANKMVMTRIANDVSWEDKISKIQAMDDSLMMTYILYDGTDSIGTAKLSNDRIMEVATSEGAEYIPYYISTTGICLQKPITFNGQSIQELRYDGDAFTLTPLQPTSSALNLTVMLPKNYMHYGDFEGTYTLSYNNGSRSIRNITFTPAGDGVNYNVTGLVRGATIQASYRKAAGDLRISTPQLVGTQSGIYYFLLPWALDGGGSVYFSSGFGFDLSKDVSQPGTVLTFSDFSGYGIDSFIIAGFTSETSLTNSTFNGWNSPILFTSLSSQLPYVTSLTKTN